jgi:hypothetical protein
LIVSWPFLVLVSKRRIMQSTGYSGTPLIQKLGINREMRVHLSHVPEGYLELLGPGMDDVEQVKTCRGLFNMMQLFVTSRAVLERDLIRFKEHLEQDGMIWVSWPKKSSGVKTDVAEDVIREICLPMQLVDIKVCAIDAIWSGLKLVIRREARK